MMLPISDDTRVYCIGIVDGNPLLLSVLNKTLAKIDDSLMQTFVMEACVIPEGPVTLGKIVEQFAVYIVLFLLAMLFMVIIGAAYIYRTNQKLRMQNTRLVTLAEVSGDLLFEYDIKLDRFLLFKGFRQTFGIPECDTAYHKTDVADLIDLDSIIDRRITGEEIEHPNGRCYKAKYSYIQGENHSEPIYLVGKLVDISEDKAQLMALANKARMDGLTNLLNSAETKDLVHKAMAQISEGQMDALFIFDVDEFKQVNDTFGHYAGDQVLVQVAEILRHTFRSRPISRLIGRFIRRKSVVKTDFVFLMVRVGKKVNKCDRKLGGRTMAELKFEIKESIARISEEKNGWVKELNLVSWNGNEAKYDLRSWSVDHMKMGKGITLTKEELIALKDVLLEQF